MDALTLLRTDNLQMLENFVANESQMRVIEKNGKIVVALNSIIAAKERERDALKVKIAKDENQRNMKRIKAEIKAAKKGLADAINKYNGIAEALLANVPGETLNEKYSSLSQNLLSTNLPEPE